MNKGLTPKGKRARVTYLPTKPVRVHDVEGTWDKRKFWNKHERALESVTRHVLKECYDGDRQRLSERHGLFTKETCAVAENYLRKNFPQVFVDYRAMKGNDLLGAHVVRRISFLFQAYRARPNGRVKVEGRRSSEHPGIEV